MNIKSTRLPQSATQQQRPHSEPQAKQQSDQAPQPLDGHGGQTWSVPRIITKPRSVVSNSIKLFRATEGWGLMNNPFPRTFQNTISGLGCLFYGANVGAELIEGDLKEAVRDVGHGWLSFTAGAKIMGLSRPGASGMYAVGGALNLGIAAEEFKTGETLTASLRVGNAVGLLLSAADMVASDSVSAVVGPLSQAVLGTVGMAAVVRDLAENGGLWNRPDMFS